MVRDFTFSLLLISTLVGCGQQVSDLRAQGGDVPIGGGSVGREDYLVYGDNSCIVANGIFMKRSGTSLTLYGDNNCPHTTFTECTGATIATLSIGGTTTKDDCGVTYRLTREQDSTTDYLRIALSYK